MSGNELKKKIEETNAELFALLKDHHYDLQNYSILACSQKLDILIVAYMQTIS